MSRSVAIKLAPAPSGYGFAARLAQHGLELKPLGIVTLQANITKLCNQVCRHCHVDASPARREMLSAAGIDKCLDILRRHPGIARLDITGGAPELHPEFERFVARATVLDKQVMVRHNLTVQLDAHPLTGADMTHLPQFFARHRVEVVSSLPYYQEYFTDAQRGPGVFAKSLEALKRLNGAGYGAPGSGLVLNLVYNPVGPYLPAAQASLEADYKRELKTRFGIVFNGLFTLTNMPINRFRLHLEKARQFEAYMEKLAAAFNPAAAAGVMCRTLISVGHDGSVYDCDFNQMLELPARGAGGRALSIFEFDFDEILNRRIAFADHCFGCTAGAGSSCGGATA